jgi:hypothetical protein
LAAVDISNPASPALLDTVGTMGCAWGLGITGHTVICGSWRVMEAFDVSNPSDIQRVGWDNTGTWAHGADIREDGLIAVADWRGMSCYRFDYDLGPDIDIDPELIDFGAVTGARETTLVVRNTGFGPLNVSAVTAPNGIAVQPQQFSIAGGDSQILVVTASGTNQVRNTVRLSCNDGDETLKTFRVYKNNTAYPQAGSIAPDFTLLGTDGQQHTLSSYRGRVVYLDFGASW